MSLNCDEAQSEGCKAFFTICNFLPLGAFGLVYVQQYGFLAILVNNLATIPLDSMLLI